MSDPITLLIYVAVLALLLGLLFWVLGQIPMPQPVRMVITVIVALVVLVWLLRQTGILAL